MGLITRMFRTLYRTGIVVAVLTVGFLVAPLAGQSSTRAVGLNGYAHIVADLDRSVKFYVDAMGLEMPRSIRALEATPWVMLAGNTPGARSSAANLRVPGGELTVELISYRDFDTRPARPRLEDPGATTLILKVRDGAEMRRRLLAAGGLEVAPNVIRDPDYFYIRLVEDRSLTTPLGGATLGVTVADTGETLKIWRDILGFVPGPTDANLRTVAPVPGARSSTIEWTESKTPDRQAIRTRLPDPGSTMLLMPVQDVQAAADALTRAGLQMVTTDGKIVEHPSGSKVLIVRDPNNIFLELIQRPGRQ